MKQERKRRAVRTFANPVESLEDHLRTYKRKTGSTGHGEMALGPQQEARN